MFPRGKPLTMESHGIPWNPLGTHRGPTGDPWESFPNQELIVGNQELIFSGNLGPLETQFLTRGTLVPDPEISVKAPRGGLTLTGPRA